MNARKRTKTLMTINTGLLIVMALYLFFWGQQSFSLRTDQLPASVPAGESR